MYISMHCVNANNTTQDEICKFYGIHYDNMYRSCVISTNHQHHDFVISMTEEDFNDLYRKNEIRHGENQKCEIRRVTL